MNKEAILNNLVRVELTDEPIIPGRSGTNDRGPWTIPPKMPAYLWQGDKYPTKIEVPVPDSGRPAPGIYLMAGTPFRISATNSRINIQFDDRKVEFISIDEAVAGFDALKKKAA